jgi:hypothetical protein
MSEELTDVRPTTIREEALWKRAYNHGRDAIARRIKVAVQAERQRCIEAMCFMCEQRTLWGEAEYGFTGHWTHCRIEDGHHEACLAGPLHGLNAAREQG